MSEIAPVLIAGQWRAANCAETFRAENPITQEPLSGEYPVSAWEDCDAALTAAAEAADQLLEISPKRIQKFLLRLADLMEANRESIGQLASQESGLPEKRLAGREMDRTTDQIRQAADAAADRSWKQISIETKRDMRSMLAAIGPVAIFSPNNFPLSWNTISGGDFASAVAAGNPVIAIANSSAPGTTKILAELAFQASQEADLPAGMVQFLYRLSHADGKRLVADSRIGATAFTGGTAAGLALKAAADAVGKPIYVAMSSVNPIVFLSNAIREQGEELVNRFGNVCLKGTGQFCTQPGLAIVIDGAESQGFIAAIKSKFDESTPGTLGSKKTLENLVAKIEVLKKAGATVISDEGKSKGEGYSHPNTLFQVSGADFLKSPAALQTEAFGNAAMFVVCQDIAEAKAVIDSLHGQLAGCIYSSTDGADAAAYATLAPRLRRKVGRFMDDKMPNGMPVSIGMGHGGPFPASGHPGFTSVGIPNAMRRFAVLQSYDQARHNHLPEELQNKNPSGQLWRNIDGQWTTGDVADA
ncbi:aldehyde dehydrogenase family protein [Blastopirellula sp. JC732]|uniref:Aldehyde dehydrogenase family protein n=1 Tax=Blastopirellula sediminis TaxID=2894196 RepID=A0A9X1MRY9_9BACT|nr:aldehyde dehydrogenase family protein [Blastopirellula sediminis]MCC9606188.1 aldehyde dehydrogenase family protein [Blastopirellula sediminis]MCC9630514.1 aldehyde dehydrogenase family protein [Blastopirellula sediminis]